MLLLDWKLVASKGGSCHWGLKIVLKDSQKLSGEGATDLLDSASKKASCTGVRWGCTVAKEALGGAKDSWETFAPWVQKTSCTLPCPFSGNFPETHLHYDLHAASVSIAIDFIIIGQTLPSRESSCAC